VSMWGDWLPTVVSSILAFPLGLILSGGAAPPCMVVV